MTEKKDPLQRADVKVVGVLLIVVVPMVLYVVMTWPR
jgi:hypothetical protein